MRDAFAWSADLGGGTRVGLVQAGRFRTDAGAIFGPVPRLLWDQLVADEIDADHRLLQALNCLVVETPAGRVLIETGIGERIDRQGPDDAPLRGRPGRADAARGRRRARHRSTSSLMSHLHFDHAGGLLLADGSRAFPRARIVAQRAEWEIALGDNSRLVASYDQPELRLVARLGRRGLGRRRARAAARRVGRADRRALGAVTRPSSCAAGGATLAFFGDLFMRPWAANPRWVTAFDDFPLDSVARKTRAVPAGRRTSAGPSCSRTRSSTRSARLGPDRDRWRFEPI